MTITEESLAESGIGLSAQGFEELTRRMTERLQVAGFITDPANDLTAAERDALTQGGFDLSPLEYSPNDPVAEAAAEYLAVLDTGLSVAEAARLLGVDASRVRQRLGDRSLYGTKFKGAWTLPRFQFDGGRVIPGFEIVLRQLDPDMYPLSVFRWFTLPDSDLEIDGTPVSPRDWLRAGNDPSLPAALARDFQSGW